jgi:hypothetical protein
MQEMWMVELTIIFSNIISCLYILIDMLVSLLMVWVYNSYFNENHGILIQESVILYKVYAEE